MKTFKISEQLDNIEEFDTYNISRFVAFAIYLEFFLRYFLAASFLDLANAGDLYNFVLANWSKIAIAVLCYYPVQAVSAKIVLVIWRLPNVFKVFRKNEEKEYDALKKQNRILALDDADEVARRFSDKKLEKEIEKTREVYRKHIVQKFRLGLIFSLLLANGLLFWFNYSQIGLILQSNLYQIIALLILFGWIQYPDPPDYEYVSSPVYLTRKDLSEIENQNSSRYGTRTEEIELTTSRRDGLNETVNRNFV